MNSIEKLDAVLECFVNIQIHQTMLNEEEILSQIDKTKIRDRDELIKVLKKLVKDEYLEIQLRFNNYSNVSSEHYTLTFEGDYFYRYEGGYLGKFRKAAEHEMQIEYYRNIQTSQANKLNTLTTWIAIGTIIAAIYYLCEIIKTWSVHNAS